MRTKMESLLALWTTTCSLKQLDRFISADQPPLDSYPLSNGSNWYEECVNPEEHDGFAFEDDLQKLIIRYLHLPGLVQLKNNPLDPSNFTRVSDRIRAMMLLYQIGRFLLQQEFNRVKTDDKDDFSRGNYDTAARWIQNSRKNIVAALEDVAILACFRPNPTQDELDSYILRMRRERTEAGLRPLTNEEEIEELNLQEQLAGEKSTQEKLNENFAEKDVLFLDQLHREMIDRLMEETHLDPLIMDLLRREDAFESALAVEHYEDKLITKQFSFMDEQEIAENNSWSKQVNIGAINSQLQPLTKEGKPREGGMYDHEASLIKTFQDMSLVNRHRRNIRLLRDWAGKRPWNQIYQLYDSTNDSEPPWVNSGVNEFNMKAIIPFEDDDIGILAPTSLDYVLPKLFGFLPIDTGNNSKAKYGCDFRRDKCILCNNAYYQGRSEDVKGFGSTIMELHCKDHHKFHLKCIFNFWDARGKYLHTCPDCGDMAKLNYEIAGLDPAYGNFVHNNQSYNTAALVAPYLHSDHPTLAKKARELYDVPAVPLNYEEGDNAMDLDMFPDPPATEAGKSYFQSELQFRVALQEMPIFWASSFVKAGARTSSMIPPTTLKAPKIMDTDLEAHFYTNQSFNEFADQSLRRSNHDATTRMARMIGDAFLKQEFERGRDDVYDVDCERWLPAARLAPAVEAAWMRGARRRREYRRREKLRAERRGLSGLF